MKRASMLISQLKLVVLGQCTIISALALLCGLSTHAAARTLETPSYNITLKFDCLESDLTCENVTFIARDKQTGNIEILHGSKLQARTRKGAAANNKRYIYQFSAPNKGSRLITSDGRFFKLVNGRTVLKEQGRWFIRKRQR